jgi:hypothetical protein
MNVSSLLNDKAFDVKTQVINFVFPGGLIVQSEPPFGLNVMTESNFTLVPSTRLKSFQYNFFTFPISSSARTTMKSGACFLLPAALLSMTFWNAYTFTAPRHHLHHTTQLFMTTNDIQRVEVCAGKDCKRSGGGPRLEKLIQQVVEEEGLATTTTVERCYCQGECGYGPNIVVDDKLINNVRGRDAVLQALGLAQEA